jgi:four helix bundle protein
MKDFRELQVWHKAHQLTLSIYTATQAMPDEERYGLISQMRRSCMSIPSNIAEGCGRGGDGDMQRFMQIAMGSASELEYQIILAHDLNYLSAVEYEQFVGQVQEVKKMLASFIMAIRKRR